MNFISGTTLMSMALKFFVIIFILGASGLKKHDLLCRYIIYIHENIFFSAVATSFFRFRSNKKNRHLICRNSNNFLESSFLRLNQIKENCHLICKILDKVNHRRPCGP